MKRTKKVFNFYTESINLIPFHVIIAFICAGISFIVCDPCHKPITFSVLLYSILTGFIPMYLWLSPFLVALLIDVLEILTKWISGISQKIVKHTKSKTTKTKWFSANGMDRNFSNLLEGTFDPKDYCFFLDGQNPEFTDCLIRLATDRFVTHLVGRELRDLDNDKNEDFYTESWKTLSTKTVGDEIFIFLSIRARERKGIKDSFNSVFFFVQLKVSDDKESIVFSGLSFRHRRDLEEMKVEFERYVSAQCGDSSFSPLSSDVLAELKALSKPRVDSTPVKSAIIVPV